MEKQGDEILDVDLKEIQEVDETQDPFDSVKENSQFFNKRFINAMKDALRETSTQQELENITEECFKTILVLANAVPNNKISKKIQGFGENIVLRIQDIESEKEKQNQISLNIWNALINSINSSNEFRLHTIAALTILELAQTILPKDGAQFSQDTVKAILSVLQYTSQDPQILQQKAQKWHKIFKKQQGYQIQDYKKYVLEISKPIKYVFLAYIFDENQDQEILQTLIQKYQELVLNDKEKSNYLNYKYFIPFLNSINLQTFSTEIVSHMQFMSKRNDLLLEIMGNSLKEIKKVELDLSTVKSLTQNVLSNEFLMKDENYLFSQNFIKNLVSNFTSVEQLQYLVQDFLLKAFITTKNTQFTPIHRQRLIQDIKVALQTAKKRNLTLNDDQLRQISTPIIEHLYVIKEEATLKEVFADAIEIIKLNSDFAFIGDVIKNYVSKITNQYQISLITELMLQSSNQNVKDLANLVLPKVKALLTSENYTSNINYTMLLALGAFLCAATQHTGDNSYIQLLFDNDGYFSYITSGRGYVNTPTYFKKNPTLFEVKYHLFIIQSLLQYSYENTKLSHSAELQLRDSLFEYLLNENYSFREHIVFDTFEILFKKNGDKIYSTILQTLYIKIKQLDSRPKEENVHLSNLSLTNKVKFVLKALFSNMTQELTKNDFLTLIQLISFPNLTRSVKDLIELQKSIESALTKRQTNPQSLVIYFNKYYNDINQIALFERSGILSQNKKLQQLAINMLTLNGIYGKLESFIQPLVKILNYKPLELSFKLQKIFEREFDRIGHYDMIMYSDMSADLLKVFNEKDEEIQKKFLSTDYSNEESKDGQEEIKVEEDPSKLMAQQLKKNAQAKKGGAVTGAKKGTAQTQQKTAQVQASKEKKTEISASKGSENIEQQVDLSTMSKEQRNKYDRKVIITYLEEIQKLQSNHIEAAQEVIKRILMSKQYLTNERLKQKQQVVEQNQIQSSTQEEIQTQLMNQNYLDIVLFETLQPSIKLMNFPYARFSTINYIQSLFQYDQTTPFFKVKNAIVSSIIAISSGKMWQKNMRDFQFIFQHLDKEAQFSEMEKGYLLLIITMANFVLKDSSTHLSVKEQALRVAQDILENNNNVQKIDLVRLTINMMKSSYSSDDLSHYLAMLIKKLNKEELAIMLQRLFEFEPIPKRKFLEELLKTDIKLFCPVWLTTQLFILQFEEENTVLAKKVWQKYNFELREQSSLSLDEEKTSKNIFYYLRSKNTQIFDSAIKAAVEYLNKFQNRLDLVIDDLVNFYKDEMDEIDRETMKQISSNTQILQKNLTSAAQSQKSLLADERTNRIATSEILRKSADLVQAHSLKKIFDFFVTQGCLDQNTEVAQSSMKAAITIIQKKGELYADEILKILEKYINEAKKYSEQSKNQAIIMIGFLANYLDSSAQKRLLGTFEKMIEMLQNTPSELIRQSICKCISQLARFFDDKSKNLMEINFKVLKESQDEKVLRGSAYAVAGIAKGLGFKVFEQFNYLQIVQKEFFGKNVDPSKKIGGIYLYETLSISLGKVFEMRVVEILPNIQQCVSDQKEQVRRAAISSMKVIMGRFSNHAIKQVLPLFLQGLENDNWRSKLASVDALGNMAYCAPRQISFFLPQIVKGIREVLNDTHEKVHSAALQAIQNIGSVIKCPEIADILETLIKALSNPNVFLKDALKVLIDTSFVHAIDAPSLSLLVPILDSGLMMHDNATKQLASTLMGNICNLTQNAEDLLPYMKILMPAIKNSLFDSIPEIRASAAKALGSLSKGLGLDNSKDILNWIRTVLHQKGLATSERSGASQGFAEIISQHGEAKFAEYLEEVKENSKHAEPQIRESYRGVMAYLPTSFDQFSKFLEDLLPLMIEGLSDESEEVRKISLRNVKICIKSFGKQQPKSLVKPIMSMMFDKDFRVRQSSSILMYQLVKELENDIIKSTPKYISERMKQKILASMFILRYDSIEKVAIQAAQIWKNIVDNSLRILKETIEVVVKMSFDIIKSQSFELQEMGLNCMKGIVEKYGEKLVNQSLDLLEVYLERATTLDETLAICKTILNMSESAPLKVLIELRSRFIGLVDPNLSSDIDEIRNISAKVFLTILEKTFEPLYMQQVLEVNILQKLHQLVMNKKLKEVDLLIQSFKFMLKSAPQLKLEDKILKKIDVTNTQGEKGRVITIAQAKAIQAVAPNIAQTLFKRKFYQEIMEALVNELQTNQIDDEQRINEVLLAFAELISNLPEAELMSINDQINEFYNKCRNKNRIWMYVDLIAYYCKNSRHNYEDYANQYMENVLVLMNEQNDQLLEKVNNCLNEVYAGLQKESQFTLVPLVKQVIERLAVEDIKQHSIYRKKVDTLRLFEKASGVKNFVNVIQNSIMHGSIDIRIDSATCFKYLIDFSKPEAIKGDIIKICGALIRVVNDKFPAELKIQIFQALKLILIKASAAVKAMVPQLQTTFLKAFNDTQGTVYLRRLVIEDLLLLIKIMPKVDPIVKELANHLDGDKLDKESKIEVAEALAIIIKNNGKTIQAAMAQQIQQILQSILDSKKTQFNDKTVTNCAVALGFLNSQIDNGQNLQNLFNQYDQSFDMRLSFGVKAGIILGGNSSINVESMTQAFQQFVVEQLKIASGIEEIDSHDWAPYDFVDANSIQGRLWGSLEILAYIGDIFIRRFGTPQILETFYTIINQSGIFNELLTFNEVSQQTSESVLFLLSSMPVQNIKDNQFSDSEKQVIKDGFAFIKKFYLDFNSKKDAAPAFLNMLQLNYDNYLDISDDKKIQNLTKEKAATQAKSDKFKDLIQTDFQMIVAEVIFLQ